MEEEEIKKQEEVIPETKQDVFLRNMKAKYPDISDKDQYYEKAMFDYDNEHDFGKKQRSENMRLAEVIKSSPEIGMFIGEILDRGADGNPEMAFAHLSEPLKRFISGDISSDEYLKWKNENTERESMYASNRSKNDPAADEWFKQKGYNRDEWLTKASDMLFKPISEYDYNPALLEKIDKMINYDEDIKAAEEAGKVSGRNEKINIQKKNMRDNDDGVPQGRNAASREGDAKEESELMSTMRSMRKNRENINRLL